MESATANSVRGIVTGKRLFSGVVGILLLALYLPAVLDIPRIGVVAVVCLGVYALALTVLPRLWLLVLPVATVGLDLAPWTGRFLFSEYDGLVVVSIAINLAFGRYRRVTWQQNKLALLLLAGYAIVYLSQVNSLGAFLNPPGRQFGNVYYSSDYSYKVAKGFVWGLLLGWLWLSQVVDNRRATLQISLIGIVVACVTLLVLGLWERGTLATVLNADNWWEIAHAVLNFSSDYRITGIFADMHTGGEVIDGLMILLLPLLLVPLLRIHDLKVTLILVVAVLSIAYCIVIGVTRATWVAAGFALGLTVLVHALGSSRHSSHRGNDGSKLALFFMLVLGVFYARWLYSNSGSEGLLCYGVMVIVAMGAGFVRRLGWLEATIAVVSVLVLLAYRALQAHLDSRYAEITPVSKVLVPISIIAFGTGLRWLVSRRLALSTTVGARQLLFMLVLPVGIALALGGYRIGDRMQNSASDLQARMNHWEQVIESAEPTFSGRLFGSGVGSFPRRYIETFPGTLSRIGSYTIPQGARPTLRLGAGGDLAIFQRAEFRPWTDYHVTVKTRSMGRGEIALRICRQNQLVFDRWAQTCAGDRLSYGSLEQSVDEEGFQLHEAFFNSHKVSEGPDWQRWPVSFQVVHERGASAVELAELQVKDSWGRTVLSNPGFEEGSDYWFFTANFAHLPWHVKNLWLQVWFETGWVGFLLAVLLLLMALFKAWRGRRSEPVVAAAAISVLSVVVVGAFGSPLDSARVSTWFYMLLVIALLLPTTPNPQGVDSSEQT